MNSNTDTDQWLETEIEGQDGTGEALGALFGSLADTLYEAPDSKRYDFQVTIEERDVDE